MAFSVAASGRQGCHWKEHHFGAAAGESERGENCSWSMDCPSRAMSERNSIHREGNPRCFFGSSWFLAACSRMFAAAKKARRIHTLRRCRCETKTVYRINDRNPAHLRERILSSFLWCRDNPESSAWYFETHEEHYQVTAKTLESINEIQKWIETSIATSQTNNLQDLLSWQLKLSREIPSSVWAIRFPDESWRRRKIYFRKMIAWKVSIRFKKNSPLEHKIRKLDCIAGDNHSKVSR